MLSNGAESKLKNQKTDMIIKLTYFKPSGKYYTDGELVLADDADMLTLMKTVRRCVELSCLPGLASGGHGYYHVVCMAEEHPQGFPFMIPAIVNP